MVIAMTNKLAQTKSPYLLQHAENPVDWYPWSQEALQQARDSDKPILLSIGYSSCHWCHVMAHESFEDPATAMLMNRDFINIKVDREERPDLDKIYQTTHQLLTGQPGGWPLTIFLDPQNQMPFFSGTYFPKEAKYNLLSFTEVLRRVSRFFKENREKITAQDQQLCSILMQLTSSELNVLQELNSYPLEKSYAELEAAFDQHYGGFSDAPKFPLPSNLSRLLNYWYSHRSGNKTLHMLNKTLETMAHSGIYDQIGGGFFRYSVDKKWMIPHFEKMLYDNAQLLDIYCAAYQITQHPSYLCILIATAQWVLKEMQAPEGGYYSTLDAESENREGKFYYWDREEFRSILSDAEYQFAIRYFGLDRSPNFDHHWHLHCYETFSETCQKLNIDTEHASNLLHEGCKKLLSARNKRIRPARDEKILTSWNALMIKAMIKTGFYLKRDDFIASANKALNFIFKNLWQNECLFASHKDGESYQQAYLDDYAFLLDAVLTYLKFRWNNDYFSFALKLADKLLTKFYDKDNGGFFFTAHDHESLIMRPKPYYDEAIPSGNSIAVLSLIHLGHLYHAPHYLEAAEKTLKNAWKIMDEYSSAHNYLLNALEEMLNPPQLVIIRSSIDTIEEWQKLALKDFHPHRLVLAIPKENDVFGEINQFYPAHPEGTVAYICQNFQCLEPILDLETFKKVLNNDNI